MRCSVCSVCACAVQRVCVCGACTVQCDEQRRALEAKYKTHVKSSTPGTIHKKNILQQHKAIYIQNRNFQLQQIGRAFINDKQFGIFQIIIIIGKMLIFV